MNEIDVASEKLSEKLYQVSSWAGTYGFYEYGYEDSPIPGVSGWKTKLFHARLWDEVEKRWPAYDLGYLLRKLPQAVEVDEERNGQMSLWHDDQGGDDWLVRYEKSDIEVRAATPEDAAAKLAIELFERDILKKETKS